jgi:hypothetical protein
MTISPKKRVEHKNLRVDGETKTVFQEGDLKRLSGCNLTYD